MTSWLDHWPRLLAIALSFGVFGNLVESLFASTGALRYHLDHKLVAFPFRKGPLVLGVPLSWLLSQVP